MKIREVVVGVVYKKFQREIKFLLLRRAKTKHGLWSGWEFPKGGIEKNENEIKTIIREIKEETGIKKFKIIKKLGMKIKYEYPEYWKRKTGFGKTIQSAYLIETGQNPKKLSDEFDDWSWSSFHDALKKLKWKSQRDLLKFARREMKIVVFDLDGVLVDTKRMYIKSFQQAFGFFGISLSGDFIATRLGPKMEDTITNLTNSVKANKDDIMKMGKFTMKSLDIKLAKPVKKSRETLLKIKKLYPIVLLTNSDKPIVKKMLKKLSVKFDKTMCSRDFRTKGSAIKLLSKMFKVPVGEVIYVGDMVRDIRIAKNAGCMIISVPGWDNEGKLKNAKPDFLIKKLEDLPKTIENL